MSAAGGRDAKPPLTASLNVMLLRETMHTQFGDANALRHRLPPDERPTVGPAILRIGGTDADQKCFVAGMTALGDMRAPRKVFMET